MMVDWGNFNCLIRHAMPATTYVMPNISYLLFTNKIHGFFTDTDAIKLIGIKVVINPRNIEESFDIRTAQER